MTGPAQCRVPPRQPRPRKKPGTEVPRKEKSVFDAYLSADNPPKTVGFVTSRFPGTLFVVYGHEGS